LCQKSKPNLERAYLILEKQNFVFCGGGGRKQDAGRSISASLNTSFNKYPEKQCGYLEYWIKDA